jgi:mannose-6-phosphate isomerase-like protein (cupin superfamily)
MSIDSEVCRVEPGDAVYIPPNAIQFLHNNGDEPIVFVCLVDPAWRKEDETIYAPEIEATESL